MNTYHFPRRAGYALFYLIFILLTCPVSQASILPAGFIETRVAQDLDPTKVVAAPDGRIFICQKNGIITIVKDGLHLAQPFISLTVDNFNERGLMSIAFDPDFETNQFVYIFYTMPEVGTQKPHNRVSRFTASGDTADVSSETVLYTFHKLSAGIHNGGALFFSNGYLFATHGDNAWGPNSQNLSSNLGKVIRLNPDGSIPTDNPFYNQTTGDLRAIYALGLRNPFNGGADPQTGKIYINDVGQSDYEEINELSAGANYGWPTIEGPITTQTPPANYQDPVHYYDHTQGCSITVGSFYNPASSPYPAQWQGKYFYGDYCHNYIKAYDPVTDSVTTFGTGFNRPLDIAVDTAGTMYVLVRQGLGGGSQEDNTSSSDGELWKIEYTGSEAPLVTVDPQDVTAPAGSNVLFTVAASGSNLNYQWQRDGLNLPGETTSSYLINDITLADSGAMFRVIVSNSWGSDTSQAAVLNVTPNNPPVPYISLPDPAVLYEAGQTITFSGGATDPEDDTLDATALTWWVDFHHDTHTHPGLGETSGITGGSFEISRTNETSDNVWYRIYLRATDSEGVSSVTYREIFPKKADITLATDPPGLQVLLDGAGVTAPYTVTGVVGVTRTLTAPASQSLNNETYIFDHWSDGGAADHDFNTPSLDTTYTAYYVIDTTSTAYRLPEDPASTANGLEYAYYEQTWYAQPDLSQYVPADTGVTALSDLSERLRDDYFGMKYTGYVEVVQQGEYTFYTSSDDGSVLYIGDSLIVDNGGLHGLQERSGLIALAPGKHAIRIEYFEKTGGQQLDVSYSGPSLAKMIIPASAYFYEVTDTTGPDPDPDPDPVEVDTLLEAEDAVVVGANFLQWIPNYTGTGYVDYSAQTGDYIEWTANIPAAGDYVLGFRYVLGTMDNRPLELKVNGVVANAALDFPITANWNDWQMVYDTVTLQAGLNTIRTTAIGYSGGNIDHLRITNVPAAGTSARRSEQVSEAITPRLRLQAYPVPADTYLKIPRLKGLSDVHLLDATGRALSIRKTDSDNEVTLETGNLPAGLYFLIGETDTGTLRQRIIIQH